jgi:SAM-dependent methyltransferase
VGALHAPADSWSGGNSYEKYVGRWSRLVAPRFVAWLAVPPGSRWLDVGCGSGALTETVLLDDSPANIVGVDPSADFLRYAADRISDPRASFREGNAQALPLDDAAVDVVVSGLVLNFAPDRSAALREMRRVTRHGGTVAAYVWDYSDGMQMMTHFWDAAAEIDPASATLHEGSRFSFCRPEPLRELFVDAGLLDVAVAPIDVPTVFASFDDYWTPFLSGGAPAPSYAQSLSEEDRAALRQALEDRLPTQDDGSIRLTARAWAVRGTSGR